MRGGGKHHRGRFATLLVATAIIFFTDFVSAAPPFAKPFSSAVASSSNVFDAASADTAAACLTDSDCMDGNGCTIDRCTNGQCFFELLPGCIPCQPGQICPPLEVVFVMDTSGSMVDEAEILCTDLVRLVETMAVGGITVRATLLGITEDPTKVFSCLGGNVVQRFGSTVPGDPGSCVFPVGPSARESWGPATAIVAGHYPWSPGSVRLIVPLGDEGPCAGSFPDGCNDPGDDRDSITNAISAAQSNGVIVSPVIGSGADACTMSLAEALAAGTGGVALTALQAKAGLVTALTRIFTAACTAADECNDNDPCTVNDHCENDICVGTTVPGCRRCVFDLDCRDNLICTTDQCSGGACVNRPIEGCTPCTRATECNDGNACTANLCDRGVCAFPPNHAVGLECCDPRSGVRRLIEDGNPCTTESCNSATGEISRSSVAPGTPCDDGADCTVRDACDAEGRCAGDDLKEISCSLDAECRPNLCDFETGQCLCNDFPYLRLDDIRPAGRSCFNVGETVLVYVVVGRHRNPITGGQFFIRFDPQVLRFIGADPGRAADPRSPFSVEFFEDAAMAGVGELFYAVGVPLFELGDQGPAVMAVLKFTALAPCRSTGLCFDNANPRNTLLSEAGGRPVPTKPLCSGEILIDDGPAALSCPASQEVTASAGELSAEVRWSAPTATDGCGAARIQCAGRHEQGTQLNALATTGGRLPQGRSDFECVAEDECGNVSTCRWSVGVAAVNTVEVNVQLSPLMHGGPLRRCIEFAFHSTCGLPPVVVSEELEFGPPFDLPGQATRKLLQIPAGKYGCVTARDPLHTLRSSAAPQVVNGRYVVSFLGSPSLGGNWLRGGNLDGNGTIDVIDYAVLLGQYLTRRPADTSCQTIARNADVNGDGVVDQLDFSFLHAHSLMSDATCCPSATASVSEAAMLEVPVGLLETLGFFKGARGVDANLDGWIDAEELTAHWMRGRSAGARR